MSHVIHHKAFFFLQQHAYVLLEVLTKQIHICTCVVVSVGTLWPPCLLQN